MKKLIVAAMFFLTCISLNSLALNLPCTGVAVEDSILCIISQTSQYGSSQYYPGTIFVQTWSKDCANVNFYISPTDPNYETEIAMLLMTKSKGRMIDVYLLPTAWDTVGSTIYAPSQYISFYLH
jgi:hypothetical protein